MGTVQSSISTLWVEASRPCPSALALGHWGTVPMAAAHWWPLHDGQRRPRAEQFAAGTGFRVPCVS